MDTASHTLVAHQSARDVEVLAADNHDLLAHEELFGHHRGQAPHQVPAGVDHDDLIVYTHMNVSVSRSM